MNGCVVNRYVLTILVFRESSCLSPVMRFDVSKFNMVHQPNYYQLLQKVTAGNMAESKKEEEMQ